MEACIGVISSKAKECQKPQAPTLVLAVLGQWDQTATPCQEEECGRYQMAHAAALPWAQL